MFQFINYGTMGLGYMTKIYLKTCTLLHTYFSVDKYIPVSMNQSTREGHTYYTMFL
jgi:hypothetical protein